MGAGAAGGPDDDLLALVEGGRGGGIDFLPLDHLEVLLPRHDEGREVVDEAVLEGPRLAADDDDDGEEAGYLEGELEGAVDHGVLDGGVPLPDGVLEEPVDRLEGPRSLDEALHRRRRRDDVLYLRLQSHRLPDRSQG